jgi:hypothetical protein
MRMRPEPGLGQREIVGRKIIFADGEVETKYTLPFVDASWHVAFVVLDLLGRPPRILEGKLHLDGRQLRTPASVHALRAVETTPAEDFGTLVHFDPWWAFRGVSGVERPWIESIFKTNIAHPFHLEGRTFKIHDLRFADGMERLESLIAKDEMFHPREFRAGDIDLLGLRSKPKDRPRVAVGSSRESALSRTPHPAEDGPAEAGGPRTSRLSHRG